MGETLGVFEFSSISKGIETSDVLLKSSFVDTKLLKHICPGKFLTIISGNTEEVKEAIEKVLESDREKLIESNIITNVQDEILKAFNKKPKIEKFDAIGAMEFSNVTVMLVALDKALKSSNVQLVKLVLGNGISGKGYFVINGSVSSIEEAEKASKKAIDNKKIIYSTVLSSPSEIILKNL